MLIILAQTGNQVRIISFWENNKMGSGMVFRLPFRKKTIGYNQLTRPTQFFLSVLKPRLPATASTNSIFPSFSVIQTNFTN